MATLTNTYYQEDSNYKITFQNEFYNLPTDWSRVWYTLLSKADETITGLTETQNDNFIAWMPIKIVANVATVEDDSTTITGTSPVNTHTSTEWTLTINTTTTDLSGKTYAELLSMPIWDYTYASNGSLTITENATKLTEYNNQIAQQTLTFTTRSVDWVDTIWVYNSLTNTFTPYITE